MHELEIEGGWRDLALGVFLIVSLIAICLFTFVGVYVVAHWIWNLA